MFIAVVLAAVFAQTGRAAARPTPVVPSLEPAATAKLWKQLAERPRGVRVTAQAACRPLRGIFYAQTDWLRLATRLAAQASPCAQYYISVPPLAASKTTLRNGEAAKIRALGPNFHTLAEINWAGWQTWVAQNNSTWFEAGVEARRRMAAAGYDVSKGDTWAVNEFPSSVRTGAGSDRQNARDLVRGLFSGDGGPDTKGTVFVVGVGQSVLDTTLYQTNLQNWFGDSGFWTDMAAYVADWSQEVYGDYRRVAVPGTSIQQRRDQLNDYLQHQVFLARAAPPAIEPGRTTCPDDVEPAGQRRLVVGVELRLDGDPVRPDAVVRIRAGLRAAVLQRCQRPAAGSLGLRLGAAEPRPRKRGLREPEPGDPRPAGGGDPRLRPADQSGRPRHRGVHRVLHRRPARRYLHTGLEVVPDVDAAGTHLHEPAADRRGRRAVRADRPHAPERDGRGPAGTVPDHDHAALELAARPVLARADGPLDAHARPLDPRGRKRGRAVLLPRHQGGQRDRHRLRIRRDERDPVGDDPPGRSGVDAGVDRSCAPSAPAPRLPCRRSAPTSTGMRFP